MIIPAFAVGRTQELVYALNQLDTNGDIPELPVFVDSPLAVNATDVFRMHPEVWRPELRDFLNDGGRQAPFDYSNLEYVRDVRRSKQLNFLAEPAIIISASGMAESGRILHHLKNNIADKANTILLVSFQAQHTLGRRLQDGDKKVRIFGDEYQVRAEVDTIEGYSAHADQAGLLAWATAFDRNRLQKFFLVHGEPEPMQVLATKLQATDVSQVAMPVRGQKYEF
ncbi:MAG: MBL fold metallo-hydrolase RNA specificity domain-containing protein [Caldilineaceae bacterium]